MPVLAALIGIGLAQSTAAVGAPPASRRLFSIPGVAISYYDAVGKSIGELHDWLDKHGPRDSRTSKPTPATSGWTIGSAVKFTKTGGQCTLTSVALKFTASAKLPRLAPGQKLSAPALASWNSYVAALEDRQAAKLGFVHDRLREVESAILRSTCANWQRAASAAIERLSQEQAQAFAPDLKTQPMLLEPEKGD